MKPPDQPHSSRASHCAIGIDLGKSHVRLGVREGRHWVDRTAWEVDSRLPSDVLPIVKSEINRIQESRFVTNIGVGVFGEVDSVTGILLKSSINPEWNNLDVREFIYASSGVKGAIVINDVVAAAFGIARTLLRGPKTFGLLMLGTGVGAAAVHNGEIAVFDDPTLSKIGQSKWRDGRSINEVCGGRGLVNGYLSATKSSTVTTASEVFALAAKGDGEAQRAFADALDGVIECLIKILASTSMETIYVAGGVWQGSQRFRKDVQRRISELRGPGRRNEKTIRSALSPWYGVYGAAALSISRYRETSS